MEIMNFKYSIEEGEEQPPSQWVKMSRVVFRDTLVEAFRWGMRGHSARYDRACQLWDQHLEAVTAVVETCLELSVNFQT